MSKGKIFNYRVNADFYPVASMTAIFQNIKKTLHYKVLYYILQHHKVVTEKAQLSSYLSLSVKFFKNWYLQNAFPQNYDTLAT